MTVYFHANFGLDRSRMAGILKKALTNPKMTDSELAKPFGYGAPFAAKYRSWLHKTGIVTLSLPMKLTPMGEVVYEHDPRLVSLTTQWFMHWGLTQDPERTETWHFFIHEFLPKHESFTQEALIAALVVRLRAHSEKHFGPGSKLNPVIARKLIDCYTEANALGGLGIIRRDGSRLVRGQNVKSRGPWESAARLRRAFD